MGVSVDVGVIAFVAGYAPLMCVCASLFTDILFYSTVSQFVPDSAQKLNFFWDFT